MGKRDIQELNYLEDNRRFADLVNGVLFAGKQIVEEKALLEANKELLFPWTEQGKRVIRDSVRKFYHDVMICVLVVESQSNIDYHMVIRNLLAEGLEYYRQWSEIARKHQKEKDLKGDEFLSGMNKNEKFFPVVTLVVYYGKEKWDAATSLYKLLDFGGYEQELRPYVSDYKIHVFDYHDYDDFGMFETELKQVFSFIKCAHDKRQLKKLIAEHKEEYYNVDRETAEFIATVTNSRELLSYEENADGGVNMCKALDEIWEEGMELGIEQGIKAFVEVCQDFGMSEEETISRALQKFTIKTGDIPDIVKTYWR